MMFAYHEDDVSPTIGELDRLSIPDAPDPRVVVDSYVSSPMYRVIDEHSIAWFVVAAMVIGFMWLRRRRPERLAAFDRLPLIHKILAWLIATTAGIHAGLVFTHEPSFYTILYAAGAVAPWFVLRRLLAGRRWRKPAAAVLAGLIVGWGITMLTGESPDQISILTKLIELSALMITIQPVRRTRMRRALATATTIGVATLISLVAWIGAFSTGGGHHLGDTPTPGVLIPAGEDREPTPVERAATQRLYEQTVAGIRAFEDPTVAAAAGYGVDGIMGTDFHAENEPLKGDGRILDPTRPETLVYAVGASGAPVLLGAMYQMDDVGEVGPAVGGPLTVWHAHDHVCFSLVPPGLGGLTSPFGLCPLGTITLPITNEMMHVWTIPGVEDPFDDLDDQWLSEYLATR